MIFEVVVFADENASIVVQPTAKVLTHTIYRKSLCRRPGKKKPSPTRSVNACIRAEKLTVPTLNSLPSVFVSRQEGSQTRI